MSSDLDPDEDLERAEMSSPEKALFKPEQGQGAQE